MLDLNSHIDVYESEKCFEDRFEVDARTAGDVKVSETKGAAGLHARGERLERGQAPVTNA